MRCLQACKLKCRWWIVWNMVRVQGKSNHCILAMERSPPPSSVLPSVVLSRFKNCITQRHYGIECVHIGHETQNYSHEGEGDHSVSQQDSH